MHPHNNLEHQSLTITSLSRTLYSPKLLLLNYGPNRGAGSSDDVNNDDDDLSKPLLLLCSGLGHQRHIPPDDEFISAEDEMSCQEAGYVW